MADPFTQCRHLWIIGPVSWTAALELHVANYGPPPFGQSYTGFPVYPSGSADPGWQHIGWYIWCLGEEQMPTFRMVTTYEYGSPPTNFAVTTADWTWLGEEDPASDVYEAVEAKYDTFFNTTKNLFGNGAKVTGYRWSPWRSDFSKTDPSIRFAARSFALGSASAQILPPQVACAITEETDIRRRWGRFYLPFLNTSSVSNGRYTSSTCDVLGAAAKLLLETIEGEWEHVTVSKLTPHTLPTRFVRVDDVPDVIRSRRWSQATYRYRSSVS